MVVIFVHSRVWSSCYGRFL